MNDIRLTTVVDKDEIKYFIDFGEMNLSNSFRTPIQISNDVYNYLMVMKEELFELKYMVEMCITLTHDKKIIFKFVDNKGYYLQTLRFSVFKDNMFMELCWFE